MIGRLHTSPGLKKIKKHSMFDVDNTPCPMHNIHKYTKTHPDHVSFCTQFFHLSTWWCSHQTINKESHLGGCGSSATSTTTLKLFPIFKSLKKNYKHMAQISFCQQQLAHYYNSITPTCLSSAIQTPLSLNREGISL